MRCRDVVCESVFARGSVGARVCRVSKYHYYRRGAATDILSCGVRLHECVAGGNNNHLHLLSNQVHARRCVVALFTLIAARNSVLRVCHRV